MSRLDINARVYDEDGDEAYCHWFLLCDRPANGLRDSPIGEVPICQRCDDKIERL